MGMTLFKGKKLEYFSDDDSIRPGMILDYQDQNGNNAKISVDRLLEKAKKCKQDDIMIMLIKDIEGEGLHIGFPIIVALDKIANDLGEDEALEILQEVHGNDSM